MGEPARRQGAPGAPASSEPKPPEVETVADLAGLEEAAAVLDAEVDRLTKLMQASGAIRKITPQVRALLAAVKPLTERKESLEAQIAKYEVRVGGLSETIAERTGELREHENKLAELREQINEAQRLRGELTALR